MASIQLRRKLTAAAATGLTTTAVITPGLAHAPHLHRATTARVTAHAGPVTPRPPLLPANFRGRGRYIVRDLGLDVPFTWQGSNGNSQMIAGGPQYPIWFTNLIYRNTLYTVTFKWPNIPLNPRRRCDKVGSFSRRSLNDALRTARFVGPEILQGNNDRHVDHWRAGVVAGSNRPPGKELRIPIALGDIYVDQKDPSQWWQVLQFGFQNLYDPQLDEWFTMTTFTHQPGTVTLPRTCPPPAPGRAARAPRAADRPRPARAQPATTRN